MSRWIVTLLALIAVSGCGGAVDSEPDESETTDVATPVEGEPPMETQRPEIPLCDGSPEPEPGLCQELRYGDRGYCNRWVECDSL